MNENFEPFAIEDYPLLHMLEAASRKADNPLGLPLAFDYPAALQNAVVSVAAKLRKRDDLAFAAWLTSHDTALHLRAYVHPDVPALWSPLLKWAVLQADEKNFVDADAITISEIILHSEFDTPVIHDYAVETGFEMYFAEEVMRCDLTAPLPDISLPEAVTLETWSDSSAPAFYRAYVEAFSTRPNAAPPPQDTWIADMSEEDTFRPNLSLVAVLDGQPVSYILSDTFTGAIPWRTDESGITGGWISQVGTIPAQRGRGRTSALMVRVMDVMASEGRLFAGLHVNVNNPNAQRVYEKLGFVKVGRRARYRRKL